MDALVPNPAGRRATRAVAITRDAGGTHVTVSGLVAVLGLVLTLLTSGVSITWLVSSQIAAAQAASAERSDARFVPRAEFDALRDEIRAGLAELRGAVQRVLERLPAREGR